MNPVPKYLARYAAAEVALLSDLPGRWQQALVIPVYREDPQFLRAMRPALAERDTLVILVINAPAQDSERLWVRQLMVELGGARWQQAHLSLHRSGGSDVLLVDRCLRGPPLKARTGVGGARRIGADIATALIQAGRIGSRWIHNTDADALLPAGYFAATDPLPGENAACVYPFQHILQEVRRPHWPVLLYEWHLHYYVEGLRSAGSPYAWHTVGSTLAVNYRHYAMVRGFPEREAGEDFHLLNKLAKTGSVCSLQGPVLQLSARHSSRVPFGTGPATRRIAELSNPWQFQDYDPASFMYLKVLLELLTRASREPGQSLSRLLSAADHGACEREWLVNACQAMQLETAIARARQGSRSPEQCHRQLLQHLDALRSLQLLHLLRQRHLPERALTELLPAAIVPVDDGHADLERNLLELNRLARQRLADGGCRGIRGITKML